MIALLVQVRRMTGVIVAAGRGVISIDDVKRFTTDPDQTTVDRPDVNICPAHGLYLANVEYNEKGLYSVMVTAFTGGPVFDLSGELGGFNPPTG